MNGDLLALLFLVALMLAVVVPICLKMILAARKDIEMNKRGNLIIQQQIKQTELEIELAKKERESRLFQTPEPDRRLPGMRFPGVPQPPEQPQPGYTQHGAWSIPDQPLRLGKHHQADIPTQPDIPVTEGI